ncbi:MAG TPA: hypothetical protein VIH01_06090 [Blastococcus sp.]
MTIAGRPSPQQSSDRNGLTAVDNSATRSSICCPVSASRSSAASSSRTGAGSDIAPPASLAVTFRRPGRELRQTAKVQVAAGSWNFVRAVDGGPPDIRSGRSNTPGDECLEIPAITNVDTSPKALSDRQREVIDEFRSKTVPLLHCGCDVADHSSDSRELVRQSLVNGTSSSVPLKGRAPVPIQKRTACRG